MSFLSINLNGYSSENLRNKEGHEGPKVVKG